MHRPVAALPLLVFAACASGAGCAKPDAPGCVVVEQGSGEAGPVAVRAETLVDGLEVPWGIAFLPDGDILVTERAGRIRLVDDGVLVDEPVAVLEHGESAEGGLLDLALDPEFATTRAFFIYITRDVDGAPENHVERFVLADDGRSATLDRVLLGGIPAGTFHDGGRLRFGPDGFLYVGTGDAREPSFAQDLESLAGKILRITADGEAAPNNPFAGPNASKVFVFGVRNVQAFDFLDDGRLIIADHGPSGELLRTGGDEVSVASSGNNLGWPDIWRCESQLSMVSPLIAFNEAHPPGGGVLYLGDAIPEWRGAFVTGFLKAEQLHVFRLNDAGLAGHEAYLEGAEGRLRTLATAPDGTLVALTSNCDGRGTCGEGRDRLLRIVRSE